MYARPLCREYPFRLSTPLVVISAAEIRILFVRLLVALLGTATAICFAGADDDYFEKQIRPLLVEHCHSCHGDKKQESGLRLTSREALLQGGETGRAVVPGKPEESLLIRAVGYLDEPKMPPKQKLAEADIEKLNRWVTMGAPWRASRRAGTPSGEKDGAGGSSFQVTPKQQAWWALRWCARRSGRWPGLRPDWVRSS